MANLADSLKAAIAQTWCATTTAAGSAVALGEGLYDSVGLPGFPSSPTPLGQALQTASDLFCGNEPQDVAPEFSPPFAGGQCPFAYLIGWTVTWMEGAIPRTVTRAQNIQATGPLSFGRISPSQQTVMNANGTVVGTAGPEFESNITDVVVTWNISPKDGQPDNCGSPPDEPPVFNPNEWEVDTNVTYDPPGGGPAVTIPVGLVFAPVTVNNDLQIEMPVRLNFNTGVSVNADVNFHTGDVNFNTSLDIDVPAPVDDPSIQPDPTAPPGDPEEEQEGIPETIIGVYVVVTDVGESGEKREIFSNTPSSNLYGPRLGSVSFHVENLVAPGLSWTKDIDIKYTKQVVYCPVPWGARDVVVTPISGTTIFWYPIVGESERSLALRAAGVS